MNQEVNALFVGVDSTERFLIEEIIGQPMHSCTVHTYNKAREVLQDKKFNIVFCEAEKKGLDAREVSNQLSAQQCIFVSSLDSDQERRKVLLAQKACYLTRPYSANDLFHAISVASN